MQRNSLGLLSLATLLMMAAAVPFILTGSNGAIASMFNAPVRWIPPDSEAVREFRTFTDQFDVHEFVLISWPGCTIDDERVKQLADEVEQIHRQRQREGKPELFTGTPNGYETLRELTGEGIGLSRQAAIARLTNVLIGPDGETTCAAFELTPVGAKQRELAVELILTAADTAVQLPREAYRLAGPPVDGIAIDQLSIESIHTFAVPSALLSFMLCWLCLRSLWFTLPVVAVAAFGQGAALSAVYYFGANMNAVLIVLPPLVFVLTVSAGIHLVNYYFDALRGENPQNPTFQAFSNGWRPCILAAVTTAIGLGSLFVSDVAPVRQFGGLGAAAILLTCTLLFLLLPGAMQWWPGKQRAANNNRLTWSGLNRLGRWNAWDFLTALLRRYSGIVTAIALLILVVLGYGLTRVTTTLDIVSLLSPETRAVQDHHWFQQNVSPLVPVEVVVRFDQENTLDLVERATLIMRVHAEILQVDMVEGAISAVTFMPPLPRGSGFRAITRQAVFRSRLDDQLDELAEAGYIRTDGQDQLWRVSGRVLGKSGVDYGQFLDRLRNRVDPLVHDVAAEGIDVTYTGVTSAVYEVQRSLLADLFHSFLTAILLVGCVMAVVLRSLLAAITAMIPNVFPPIILFGAMGWMGWAVDIGLLMTASVALGIAVDGTFHFLASYKRELRQGNDPFTAIRNTYGHCGQALVQTTLICAVGMLVFTTSEFLPARSFAWMLMLLLAVALFGDLIVLPSLLAGPLGRWFLPPPTATVASDSESSAPPSKDS